MPITKRAARTTTSDRPLVRPAHAGRILVTAAPSGDPSCSSKSISFAFHSATRLGHWAIYALLVLVPVTAILGAWFEGHPLTVLAVGNLQPWLPPSRQLGLVLADIHGWLGDVLIWLAGFHAGAALYHHFWRRDTVLLSMLPGR